MRTAPVVLAALLVAGVLAGGCATGRSARDGSAFSYLSAARGPLAGRELEEVAVNRGIEARVQTHVFFWVPTRSSAATLEEAIAEALRRGGGDLLVNASAERVAWYVPPFYGREGWVVRGDVLRVRRRGIEADSSRAPALPSADPWRRPSSLEPPEPAAP